MDWDAAAAKAIARYEAGETRGLDQRQLTQLANAAWAAGLNLLMAHRADEAAAWFRRAAERYRESWAGAPADSWGRPIAAMKSLLLAGDDATEAARWALHAGARDAPSPVGTYAAALAHLVLHEDAAALPLAEMLRSRDDFPRPVADALAAVAGSEQAILDVALEELLADFEQRADFLEDVPVADTVLVLQRLATARGLAPVELRRSSQLP